MSALTEWDAEFDARTRALCDAHTVDDILRWLGDEYPGNQIRREDAYAWAFGTLCHRARVTLARLDDARKAQLNG